MKSRRVHDESSDEISRVPMCPEARNYRDAYFRDAFLVDGISHMDARDAYPLF